MICSIFFGHHLSILGLNLNFVDEHISLKRKIILTCGASELIRTTYWASFIRIVYCLSRFWAKKSNNCNFDLFLFFEWSRNLLHDPAHARNWRQIALKTELISLTYLDPIHHDDLIVGQNLQNLFFTLLWVYIPNLGFLPTFFLCFWILPLIFQLLSH